MTFLSRAAFTQFDNARSWLLELVPWVKQWHNEPSEEEYGGLKLGDYFEGFVAEECSALGLSEEDLRNWRPPEKKRGGRRKKGKG